MKKIIFFILLSTCFLNVFSQQENNVTIDFGIVFNNIPIVLHDSTYQTNDGNAIKFETLKFYCSNIKLLQNGISVFSEQNSFHLIDISDSSSQNIFLKLNKAIAFNQIKFNLGIDSLTNVSGAMGGDLDPTKGMYWTWKNGYVNFKMEGACSTCLPSNRIFEFHLGGYQYPFNSLQKIELNTNDENNLKLILDINKFFNQVDLTKQKHIMSPCVDAVILSQHLANCFSLK